MEFAPQAWTDAELDESILKLCEEFPDARMIACARAIEYCRRTTPRGTPQTLHSAMRGELQREAAIQAAGYASAA